MQKAVPQRMVPHVFRFLCCCLYRHHLQSFLGGWNDTSLQHLFSTRTSGFKSSLPGMQLNARLFFTSGFYFHNATRWPPDSTALSRPLQDDIQKPSFALLHYWQTEHHTKTFPIRTASSRQRSHSAEMVHIRQEARAT